MSNQKYPQAKTVTSTGEDKPKRGRERYSHAKADARKQKRRDDAEDRQAKYDALTLTEKVQSCVPGGSKKQLAKLEKKLANEPHTFSKKVGEPSANFRLTGEPKGKTPKSKIVQLAKANRPSKS